MQKTIKPLLERNAYIIAIVITIIIAYLSLGKPLQFKPPIEIIFLDKIFHATAYFVLTLSWLFALRTKPNKNRIIILLFLFGLLMEFLQGALTTNRQQDVFDALANTIGIIIAVVLFNRIYKTYQNYFE